MTEPIPGRLLCRPSHRKAVFSTRAARVAITLSALGFCLAASVAGAQPTASAEAAPDKSQERLQAASQELIFFNFDRAYELFTQARTGAEPVGGPDWQRATLGLALSAHARAPSSAALLAEAQRLYESLADPSLASPLAPRALIQLGRIAEVLDFGGDVVDLDKAIGYYQRVHETWPQLDIADEAMLLHGVALTQQYDDPAKVRRGIALMLKWVEGREDRPLASAIYEAVGWSRLKVLDDAHGALTAFVKADELGILDTSTVGQQYYLMGELAETRVGDVDTAVTYYQKVIRMAPRSGRAFEAKLGLDRLAAKHPDRRIEVPELTLVPAAPDAKPAQGAPLGERSEAVSPPATQPEQQP